MTQKTTRQNTGQAYPVNELGNSGGDVTAGGMDEPDGEVKESRYYMDNYEATITVHQSPPMQRRQAFEYLEIDDETKHEVESALSTSRLSKRKNLRVTFSDHIDVDVFESFDYLTDSDSDEGIVETLYELPRDRNKGIKQIATSAEFRSVSENIGQNNGPSSPEREIVQTGAKSVIKASPALKQQKTQQQQQQQPLQPPPQQQQVSSKTEQNQPLLQKRRSSRVSLSDLEKRTKDYILQLQEKNKRAEAHARVAKKLFPDISSKVKTQPSYKQFIDNAKRAVEITRRYERPWASGSSGTQQTFSVWRKRSENIRRTSSLPKNFKIPDNLTTSRPSSDNVMLSATYRQRIKNS